MAFLKTTYGRLASLLEAYSIWIIALLHGVGIVGLLSPFSFYFKFLTPFNLLFCGFLIWLNHAERKKELVRFALFSWVLGYCIEWVGVHTGWPFGHYTYGPTLGARLFDVPVIIGLNWFLIIYCVAVLTDSFRLPLWLKVPVGALLAVGMDWLIEPVAIRYDFWSWLGNTVPLMNYIGWFFTSLVMLTAYQVLGVRAENKLAWPLYLTQLIFFLVLALATRL